MDLPTGLNEQQQRYHLHALGSRVTRMMVYLELLKEADLSESRRAELLQSLMVQAQRLKHLVTLILAGYDLPERLATTSPASVPLPPLFARLLGEYQTVNPDLRFRLLLPNAPLRALGDARAIEIILETLLDQAIEGSMTGGEIQLGVASDPLDKRLIIYVNERGAGNPLYRCAAKVDKPPNAANDAAGKTLQKSGLNFVQLLVNRLGGELGIESQLGQGTTFRFSLPLDTRA